MIVTTILAPVKAGGKLRQDVGRRTFLLQPKMAQPKFKSHVQYFLPIGEGGILQHTELDDWIKVQCRSKT